MLKLRIIEVKIASVGKLSHSYYTVNRSSDIKESDNGEIGDENSFIQGVITEDFLGYSEIEKSISYNWTKIESKEHHQNITFKDFDFEAKIIDNITDNPY